VRGLGWTIFGTNLADVMADAKKQPTKGLEIKSTMQEKKSGPILSLVPRVSVTPSGRELQDAWKGLEFDTHVNLIDELLREGECLEQVITRSIAEMDYEEFLEERPPRGQETWEAKGVQSQIQRIKSLCQRLDFYQSEIISVVKNSSTP